MSNAIKALARPEIVNMNAYRSARSETSQGSIWLDANENPWNDKDLNNRYPDPQPLSLISQLATMYDVDSSRLILTRGSDESIDLLVRLFCKAGQDKILICPPTYGMYEIAATIQNAEVVKIPLLKEENFAINVADMLSAWNANVKIIFLCSPNNPTGNLLAIEDILLLCEKLQQKAIVVVDEAYIEFANTISLAKQISSYSNLVILRTLSKAYGLAGIRCGVTIADKTIIDLLKKIIAPYPISKPIINIAMKKLNSAITQQHIKIINEEKAKLFNFLVNQSFVKNVWKSEANFLLFEAVNPKLLLKLCADNGVILRDRNHEYNLTNCIRTTIGSPQENAYLMEVLSYA